MMSLANLSVSRRMKLSDAEIITNLANHPAIAATTMRMPYPCYSEYIENWIKKDMHVGGEDSGFFVISLKESNEIIGVIGLEVEPEDL